MKIVFSESYISYADYQFRYSIWAFPEPDEHLANLYAHGFMPSPGAPAKYYLSRSTRVNLGLYKQSSENRRILKKCPSISMRLIKKDDFCLSDQLLSFCIASTRNRYKGAAITEERARSVFAMPHTTHVLVYQEEEKIVGLVTLQTDEKTYVHYNQVFYDHEYASQSLGIFMITAAVERFASDGYLFIYLGTCYGKGNLYKTQFKGFEFFDGANWSDSIRDLRYRIEHEETELRMKSHLLESDHYLQSEGKDLVTIRNQTLFGI